MHKKTLNDKGLFLPLYVSNEHNIWFYSMYFLYFHDGEEIENFEWMIYSTIWREAWWCVYKVTDTDLYFDREVQTTFLRL